MNDDEREQWVDNHEALYNWMRRSGKSKRAFVRANRAEIDAIIEAAKNPPQSNGNYRSA